MRQILILTLMLLPSLGCKQSDLSDAKIDQTANNTVTRLAQSAFLKFKWRSVEKGDYGDGLGGGDPDFTLTVSICADHQGANPCRYVDFKDGYYSSSYPYMTKIKYDGTSLNYAFEITGAEIERAATGRGTLHPGPLRKLHNNDYKDYYLDITLWDEDPVSDDDMVGWGCKYLEDIHTGSIFTIYGESNSKAIIEVVSAGFDDDQVFPSNEQRSNERLGCRD